MRLLLRKQSLQSKLIGSTAEWKDDDYAVLDGEEVIGRIYKIDGGPQDDQWKWSLNHHKFYKDRRSGIVLQAIAQSRDAAMAELKGEYAAWLERP